MADQPLGRAFDLRKGALEDDTVFIGHFHSGRSSTHFMSGLSSETRNANEAVDISLHSFG